jgi:putative protease
MTQSSIEIMAPAGSWESMMAAIKAGANSVYFGVEQLNMRARQTNNFLVDDLPEVARVCAEHGVKSYITLNTIIYDHDISLMRRIIDQAKDAGITAVIASDLAVMNYCRKKEWNSISLHSPILPISKLSNYMLIMPMWW